MTSAERATELARLLQRDEEDIRQLLTEGRSILIEWRGQRYYNQFNRELAERTGQPPFVFDDTHYGQLCIGGLLGEISRIELPEIVRVTRKRALLSVLVWHKLDARDTREDWYGNGFYDLTEELVGLPGGGKASKTAKERSIVEQTHVVTAYIDAITPRRRGRRA